MSSQQGSKVNILYDMLIELSNYKRDREKILSDAVKERLNQSFKNYYDSIVKTYEKLEYKDEMRMLRKLNKM